jgi:hypothetical protein
MPARIGPGLLSSVTANYRDESEGDEKKIGGGQKIIRARIFGQSHIGSWSANLSLQFSFQRGAGAASSESGRQCEAIQIARKFASNKAAKSTLTMLGPETNISIVYMTSTEPAA